MASATHTEVFNCKPEQFYSIVTDYEKYHEFLQEVKQCKILKVENGKKLVEYNVSVVKTFKYNMLTTEKPGLVSWEFVGGDIFKTSSGHWKIEAEGANKTKATYHVEATFGLLVPGPITKALVSVNLPNMMASYHKRVSQLFGK